MFQKYDIKLIGIILACVLAFGGAIFLGAQSTRNTAISYEEQVYTSKSNIKVQEKRRVDLLYNMVDAVKAYDKHEANTLKEVVAMRASKGQINQAQLAIAAVAEQYPQLKSSDLYKDLMNEFAMTENRIATYRSSYNDEAKVYIRYTRSFPANVFLGMAGYEITKVEYLTYEAPESAPTNLFQ